MARYLRRRALVACAVALAAGAIALVSPAIAGAVDIGFQGPNTSGNSNPTAEKPESKLWFNDGIWWGALWDSVSPRRHEIFRLDTGTQTWTSTNVVIDSRTNTHVDALWDGTKLYVASHIFDTTPQAGGPSNLYRYSYNAATDTYTLDPGFPAVINSDNTEALVIDKDSLGNLWATWMRANQIWVSHTSGNDAVWGTPFVLPTTDAGSVSSDDMSSLIAFSGQIGVMYSDQTDNNMHFAVHVDGAADSAWTHENAYGPQTNCPATSCADDHINLKAFGGKVYAATKTSLGGSNPLINLLVRDTNGSWSAHVFGTTVPTEDHTRPIVLIDATSGVIHMFATGSSPGSTMYDLIYEKTSPISNISFPSGAGTPFIDPDGSTPQVNNATSTKQNLTSDMGLVVISSGGSNYWHNSAGLAPDTTLPVVQTADANGASLTLTYNESLNEGSVPAPGAFSVSGGHAVTAVDVVGQTVLLTLSPAVTQGETGLTVSYTEGAAPIEDLNGNDAANLVNFAVTNSTGGGGGSLTLLPNGDVSTSNLSKSGGSSFSDAIDDTIAGADDGSTNIYNSGTAGSNLVTQLSDTPASFTSMSALTIDARARTTGRADDTLTLFAQVFRSDGTTPLTNEVTVMTNPSNSGFVTFSGISFTGVVAADKAAWDGAKLRLRWTYSIAGSSDSAKLKVTAVELDATGSSGPDVTAPVLQSAVVNGATLTMTYNEALNPGSVPANGDFAISGGHSVTGRNVTGSTVVLTLSPAVVNGEVVTMDYTAGPTPIEDPAGNDAANLDDRAVTNNTPPTDVTAPVLQSASVNGATLTMTYNEALNPVSVPANGDFAISGGHTVTNRNVTGSTVVLTLSPAVVNGEVVTMDYTAGPTPIEDPAGNDAANLDDRAVTNNTPPPGGGSLTLRPNGDGTITPAGTIAPSGTATLFDAIDEPVATSDDGTTYVKNNNKTSGSYFAQLTDTPGAFAQMQTMTIDARLRTTGAVDDQTTLFAQVFQANGVTPLTNEVSVATNPGPGGFVTISGVPLTGLVGGSKATWDGAQLRLRWSYTPVGSQDTTQIRLSAVELDGTF